MSKFKHDILFVLMLAGIIAIFVYGIWFMSGYDEVPR